MGDDDFLEQWARSENSAILSLLHGFQRPRIQGECMVAGRSARQYKQQAVDEKAIRRLIEAATEAPNAVNQQPWTFTVVRDQAVLDQVSHDAKAHMLATLSSTTRRC